MEQPKTAQATEPTASRVGFIRGLKSSAARVEHADPLRLVRRMLAEYGRSQLYEWYKACLIGKVIFDVDGKRGTTTAEALLEAALAGLAAFFGHMPDRYIIAAAHGTDPDHPNGNKLSYRIYVPGVRMRMSDIKARLIRLGLDKNRPFDAAIYGSQQKLRMAGSIKTEDDRRPLKLVDEAGAEIEPTVQLLLDTLVQVVEDQWPLIEEPKEPEEPMKTALAKRSATSTTVAVAVAPEQPPRKRGRPTKDNTLPAEWRDALDSMGFKEVHSKGAFQDARGRGFSFSSTSRASCPCCTREHVSNNW